MNIKILYHILPWEIDYALLTYIQLKKSKYHLAEDVNITIETVLNLSSYIINWENSKLPKEYFINKFNDLNNLLIDYNVNPKIYDGNELWGHLDYQKEIISPETDYYISLCPDIYFSEYVLSYLIESTRVIKNKYFMITPQISKLWDYTWDEITNDIYSDIDYNNWDKIDTFDIRYNNKVQNEEISLYKTKKSKWAGWFDIYNKAFYEELCFAQDDWKGYGPWDWYSLLITDFVKNNYKVDFQQYVLQGETIFEYCVGPLKGENLKGFSQYYKNMMVLNDIPDQRKQFESKLQDYLNIAMNKLKEKNII